MVAGSNTPVPGGEGTFNQYAFPSLSNGNVAFGGNGPANPNNQISGIYTNSDGKLQVVANRNTLVPDSTDTFSSFSGSLIDDGTVAFVGSSLGSSGNFQSSIYTNARGELQVIADENTSVPGSPVNFSGFSLASLDNGTVVFDGYSFDRSGNFQNGIYTNIGGTLAEVIAKGDVLDGAKVDNVYSGSESLSGNQVAFVARLNDGRSGVYVATVPEPSSLLGTLAFGTFGASWLLKGKLRKWTLSSLTESSESSIAPRL